MQSDGLVHEGWRSVSGMMGLCPHVLNHQWASVGGVVCVRLRGSGLVEGRGDVTCGRGQEYQAYTGLEDRGRTEGAWWEAQ